MAEEGAQPRAGDADGVAGGRFARQHENVGKQLPHGLGFDVAAIWRAGFPALFVPIGEKLLIRRMLHTLSLLRAGCWNGTFLSRFRACADPGFVVQKGLCSVHAEAGRAGGFCVVNVKLTLGLARASDLLLSRASELSAGSWLGSWPGFRTDTAASNELAFCAGRGGTWSSIPAGSGQIS